MYIVKIIQEVTDAMKSGTAISITDNGDGTFTINSNDINYIADDNIVSITDNTTTADYKVSNVVAKTSSVYASFDITASSLAMPVTFIGQKPLYIAAHLDEIIEDLSEEDKIQRIKYPLIMFPLDVTEIKDNLAYHSKINMNLIICVDTKREYKRQEREDNSFIPILEPIRDDFLTELASHAYIQEIQSERIPKNEIKRYFWGKEERLGFYNQNILNDYIDAIEITNIEVVIKSLPATIC